MEVQSPAQGPLIQVRRYGRRDFEHFCQDTARGSSLCIGSQSIGNVDVDCKYHWKKSQWGVMGSTSNPAGIVYMDITFHQLVGYNLKRLSIYITLSEDALSYALAKNRQRHIQKQSQSLNSNYAVQFTRHYGPRCITGIKSTLTETKSRMMMPKIGVMGFQAGGIGQETSTSRDSIGRWEFQGKLGRPIDEDGFRTLKWELSYNSPELIQDHRREFRTAFAFEHSQRPVYMRVEINGEMWSKASNLKDRLFRFSSLWKKQDESTLTRIDLNARVPLAKRLDTLASALNEVMERENCKDTAVEIPGPKPASFTPEPLDKTDPSTLKPNSDRVADGPKNLSGVDDSRAFDLLKEQVRHPTLRQDKMHHGATAESDKASNTISWDSSESLPTTAVNPVNSATSGSTDDPTLELLAIPGVMSFLKVIGLVLKWCNILSVALGSSSDSVMKDQLPKDVKDTLKGA